MSDDGDKQLPDQVSDLVGWANADHEDYDDWQDDEEFLAAWSEADRAADGVLQQAVSDALAGAPPVEAITAAAANVKAGVEQGRWPFGYFSAACPWGDGVPSDDMVLWLDVITSTIEPPNDPGTSAEEQAAVGALMHADWLAIVVGLVRRGVGARLDAHSAVRDLDSMPELEGEIDDPEDVEAAYEFAFTVLTPLWQAIGVLDDDERLTALGRWGLPTALHVVWTEGSPLPTVDADSVDPRNYDDSADAAAHREPSAQHPNLKPPPGPTGDSLSDEDVAVALDILAERAMQLDELRTELAKRSVFTDVSTLDKSLVPRPEVYPFDDGAIGNFGVLAEQVVLTHRVSSEELELQVLDIGVDLDLFGLVALDPVPLTAGGEVRWRTHSDDVPMPRTSTQVLAGPSEWLSSLQPGDLVRLRYVAGAIDVQPASMIDVDTTTQQATMITDIARALAEQASRGHDSDYPGISALEIVLTVRRHHPDVLTDPIAPLSELVSAAGLEIDGSDVGLPGTEWERVPDFLTEPHRSSYRRWLATLRTHRRTDQLPDPDELVELAAGLEGIALDLAATDIANELARAPIVDAMAEATSGPSRAAALYMQSRIAEAEGDTARSLTRLDSTLEADPAHREALGDLGDLRAIQGIAREAHRLYGLAGRDNKTPEMQALRKFLDPPAGEVGRNRPCPCGSGKKYKLCHGRTALHPLGARAPWLWFKLSWFAERSLHRDDLLEWAALRTGLPRDDRMTVQFAMVDPVTRDFAVFDGGLVEVFADAYDSLLPSDESELLEAWMDTPRRLLEVLEVRPMHGVLAKDLLTGEMLEVSDRRMTTQIKVKDLIYARPLADGEGELRFQSDPLQIPRLMRSPLLRMLREDAPPEEILDLLSPNRRMPDLQTSEGEELLMCSARYDVDSLDETWDRLAARLRRGSDEDELLWDVDMPNGGNVLRGRVTRAGGRLTIETFAIERLRKLQELVREVDPGARLVDESSRSMESLMAEREESGRLPGPVESPDLPPDLPPEAVDDIVRQMGERWLSDSIPALSGRTPREAAADPHLRPELEALLDDFEWTERQHPSPMTMDVGQLRKALGLSD